MKKASGMDILILCLGLGWLPPGRRLAPVRCHNRPLVELAASSRNSVHTARSAECGDDEYSAISRRMRSAARNFRKQIEAAVRGQPARGHRPPSRWRFCASSPPRPLRQSSAESPACRCTTGCFGGPPEPAAGDSGASTTFGPNARATNKARRRAGARGEAVGLPHHARRSRGRRAGRADARGAPAGGALVSTPTRHIFLLCAPCSAGATRRHGPSRRARVRRWVRYTRWRQTSVAEGASFRPRRSHRAATVSYSTAHHRPG